MKLQEPLPRETRLDSLPVAREQETAPGNAGICRHDQMWNWTHHFAFRHILRRATNQEALISRNSTSVSKSFFSAIRGENECRPVHQRARGHHRQVVLGYLPISAAALYLQYRLRYRVHAVKVALRE